MQKRVSYYKLVNDKPFEQTCPFSPVQIRSSSSRLHACLISPRPDNTCIYELHNLIPHCRVLHVVLQRLRVGLRLLQDALHHRIGHDSLSPIMNQPRQ